jgi:cytochrome o ubiquinol oxidase subunit IV
MSKHEVAAAKHEAEGSVRTYVMGFAFSIYLTLTAYLLVTHRAFSKSTLVACITGLALLQFIIQLKYFLHLGAGEKPRWKVMVFYFMIVVVLIIVLGSLWIMTHLNYHMKTPAELKTFLRTEESL